MKLLHSILASVLLLSACCESSSLRPWKEGYLDIHQISTGRGNASFMILPDGTTMMVDMGDMGNVSHFKQEIMPAVPSAEKSPAQWVAQYVRHFSEPLGNDIRVDYMMITHYDSDHIGVLGECGISELDSLLQIEKLAARGLAYEKFVVGSDS